MNDGLFFARSKCLLTLLGCVLVLSTGVHAQNRGPGRAVDRSPALTLANPRVAAVAQIQTQHTPALLRLPAVVGTATGLDAHGQLIIRVFTEVPAFDGIPARLGGVPVDVEVTGMFKAFVDPAARFDRPVPIGTSTGHPEITAGTIGCRVKDGNGRLFALSNNHVYANENEASVGDPAVLEDGDIVLQPGPYDGGIWPDDGIGWLFDFESIRFDGSANTMDAAIAFVDAADLGVGTPGVFGVDGYGVPNSVTTQASIGMLVQKCGRTTGWTQGEVSAINAVVNVCYQTRGPFRCVKSATFVDQIIIEPGTFSAGGDSGSLIVTDDASKQPVGLLFAGSDVSTIANPIDLVLNRFGVTVDDGSGVNQLPVAEFSPAVTELTLVCADLSYDPDGSIDAWAWDFGDGTSSGEQNPSHTYAAVGTYTVTLTVIDNEGADDSIAKNVTVGSEPLVLTATGEKIRGTKHVTLQWSPGGSTHWVRVHRNGAEVAITEDDGHYEESLGKGGGTFVYQISIDGVLSNESSVIF